MTSMLAGQIDAKVVNVPYRIAMNCLICNKSKRLSSIGKDIFTQDDLHNRLEPILQVTLTETTCHTRWLCQSCEEELCTVELYYKVLSQFKSNFIRTASLYGLELVPLNPAQGQKNFEGQGQTTLEGQSQLAGSQEGQEDTQIRTALPSYQVVETEGDGQVQIHVQEDLPLTAQEIPLTQAVPFLQQFQTDSQWEQIVFCVESHDGTGTSLATLTVPSGVKGDAHIAPTPGPADAHAINETPANETGSGDGKSRDVLRAYHERKVGFRLAPNETQTKSQRKTGRRGYRSKLKYPFQGVSLLKANTGCVEANEEEDELDRPFSCVDCGSRFKKLNHLRQHARIHTGEKPYICPVCERAFSNVSNLNRHMITHQKVRPFPCNMCNASFTQSCHLKRHMVSHTSEHDIKKYECVTCGRQYRSLIGLKEHYLWHTGRRPFLCPVCKKSFRVKRGLREHMVIHSDERPFKCGNCSFAFRRRSDLITHQRTHSNEKPYVCDVCDARFTFSGSLLTHKRMHTGERPFKCDRCDSCFLRSSGLWRHKKFHCGTGADVAPKDTIAMSMVGEKGKHKALIAKRKPRPLMTNDNGERVLASRGDKKHMTNSELSSSCDDNISTDVNVVKPQSLLKPGGCTKETYISAPAPSSRPENTTIEQNIQPNRDNVRIQEDSKRNIVLL